MTENLHSPQAISCPNVQHFVKLLFVKWRKEEFAIQLNHHGMVTTGHTHVSFYSSWAWNKSVRSSRATPCSDLKPWSVWGALTKSPWPQRGVGHWAPMTRRYQSRRDRFFRGLRGTGRWWSLEKQWSKLRLKSWRRHHHHHPQAADKIVNVIVKITRNAADNLLPAVANAMRGEDQPPVAPRRWAALAQNQRRLVVARGRLACSLGFEGPGYWGLWDWSP